MSWPFYQLIETLSYLIVTETFSVCLVLPLGTGGKLVYLGCLYEYVNFLKQAELRKRQQHYESHCIPTTELVFLNLNYLSKAILITIDGGINMDMELRTLYYVYLQTLMIHGLFIPLVAEKC